MHGASRLRWLDEPANASGVLQARLLELYREPPINFHQHNGASVEAVSLGSFPSSTSCLSPRCLQDALGAHALTCSCAV